MAVAELLVDTSALVRLRFASVAQELAPLLESARATICLPTLTELLWSTRDPQEYADVEQEWSGAELLEVEPVDWRWALQAQGELWRSGSVRQVGWTDLLLCAVASRHRLMVVHYDGDFEAVSAVADVATHWVVPAGSVA